ncbi:hypothetical protein SBA2_30005 [Acidobacteriia bacterium SbA2]|nr:hypothetical protein SBA2_30005 [Acidobacteriia bacterium SbA2]
MRRDVEQAVRQFHILHVVRSRRPAQFATPAIQNVERGRAGREVHVLAAKVVSFVPQDIVEFETVRNGRERSVNEILSKPGVTIVFIHLRAVPGQQVQHGPIVDFKSEFAHYLARFRDDLVPQSVVE